MRKLMMVFASVVAFGGIARAELSQRDQQEAAKRAYEAAAREHEEVAREAERAKRAAEAVRDAAIAAEKALLEKALSK